MKVKSVVVVGDGSPRDRIQDLFREGNFDIRLDRPEDLGVKEIGHPDLVVEAVAEDFTKKEETFRKLDNLCDGKSILATTTSLFSITALASRTSRPDRVAGLHFVEPVESNPLVEVVRGVETSDETIDALGHASLDLKKISVNVKDSPGFIYNRVVASMINEAAFVLMYGVASMEDIDKMMQLGGNWPKGPFEFADEIGIDKVLAILERLYQEMGPAYRPCPVLRQKVFAGHLGKKAGKGFYDSESPGVRPGGDKKKESIRPAESPGIRKVCVLGAGLMGHGIAQVAAQAGLTVTMTDINEEVVNAGLKKIQTFLDKGIQRGKLSREDADAALSRISLETDFEAAARDADLIIEAVSENVDLKKEIFQRLDLICRSDVIFASNTSQLSITEMASATKRGDQFIGMHWFNPPQLMRGIELVMGVNTSEQTLRTMQALCRFLGKEPAICQKDLPGFVVTRVLQPWYNEGMHLWDEGIATIEDIDRAVKIGGGFPMGPLTLRDLVGLDTALQVCRYMYQAYGDTKFRPPQCLIRNVAAGRLGRKTGNGFYDY
jgi:3-hydroxybutyryl-CoA dehydrogenase